ncbi:alpha/beta-hydrolase [Neocallimastix lanati (nom. inval.)]|jgi:acetyl esterase/lipase|uniref:Alpha/beta-hydrolase n=1 Tax=Neocallimastix californiae TaxID=1754190 RepID=A0A1Y2FCR5_9FUNG|nr:alpha/beta-hydrolase [Neocallimastix sp. JGI-2020a]ORY81106.1 alpha/beta-hydrolase [Neocallimastix californiae]|eukprot:ORY81106.1 alpha/beta-hydrolase [Neocallimastix californiae]
MKSSILIRLFAIITVTASTFASPLANLKKHNVTLAKDGNVNYYKDLPLDVYYQDSKFKKFEKRPVVVYIYGGGWCSGNKEKNSKIGEYLREQGYIAVLPNYHVYPNATSVETMVDEIHHAIEWTYKNIHKYGGDKHKMSISGQSAGAHLISLTLTKAALGMKNLGKPLRKLPTFKHALLLNGPYTIQVEESIKNYYEYGMDLYADGFTALFLNKTNYSPQEILTTKKSKSIKYLSAKHITFLECTNDEVVAYGTAAPMIEQVKRTVRKTTTDHVVVEGADHNKINHGIRDGDEEAKKIFIDLIRKYNKN